MLRSIAVVLFVSGALLACKDDEPSARKSLGGVEGQTPLKELDDAQREAVCDAADEKLESTFDDDDLTRGRCLLGAYVSAPSAAQAMMRQGEETEVCEELLEDCVDMPGSPSPACPRDVNSTCTASVNDLDRSITLADDLYRELSDLDCEDLLEDENEALDTRIGASANAYDVVFRCFAEELPDAGTPDASDPVDASDPILDATQLDATDDDAGWRRARPPGRVILAARSPEALARVSAREQRASDRSLNHSAHRPRPSCGRSRSRRRSADLHHPACDRCMRCLRSL
jgi:hypothetical protein